MWTDNLSDEPCIPEDVKNEWDWKFWSSEWSQTGDYDAWDVRKGAIECMESFPVSFNNQMSKFCSLSKTLY